MFSLNIGEMVVYPPSTLPDVKGALIKMFKEEIIKMVRQIKDSQSIKMIYGFVKVLTLKEKDSGS